MEEKINWDNYFPMPNERNKERIEYLLGKEDKHIGVIQKLYFDSILEQIGEEFLSYVLRARIMKLGSSHKVAYIAFSKSHSHAFLNECVVKVSDKYITTLRYKDGVILESHTMDTVFASLIEIEKEIKKIVEQTKINILNYLEDE